MSLTLSTLPSIYPAYSNNLVVTATESTANANFTYKFLVYTNSTLLDSYDLFADPIIYKAELNLSSILSTQFTSSVYTVSGSTLFELVPNSVLPYIVVVKSYNSTGTLVNTTSGTTKYVYNGCTNTEETFDQDDYIYQIGKTSNFLTKWNTDRMITINDKAYVSTVIGQYTGYPSAFGGVIITRYQNNGTSSGVTFTNSNNTTKCIMNIDVTPSKINTTYPNFISSDTEYYTIKEKNNRTNEVMRIDIIKEYKLTKFYNFLYLNSLGGTDFFTFTKVSSDKYDVTRKTLDQFTIQKVYNTTVDKEVEVLSDWISQYQNDKVKELYYSPAVKLWFNSLLNDIQVTLKSFTVRDRYPKNDLISHTISFKYNYKYYVQKY